MAIRTADSVIKATIVLDGRSLTQLARDARVSQPMVTRFMNGQRSLTIRTMDKLMTALDLELVSKHRHVTT
jgi:transcriptional regulator with XRE-family HTH domain